MRLLRIDVQVDDQVWLGEPSDEPRKQASPGKSVHSAERELAMKMPVHDHQAVEFPGTAV